MSPVTTSLLSTSVVAQDLSSFLQHYSPVSRQSETRCSHGMKRKIHKESTQRIKVALGIFLPCIRKKKCSITATRSPPNLYTPRHCYPLENHTEYSTSRFVLLHLNCKTRGRGTEIRIYQVYTEYDSLWIHTEIRGNSWTAFFFLVASMTANDNSPPCLISTSPLRPSSEGQGGR